MGFDFILLIVQFIAFFLALTAHEFAHALAAYYLGDETAAQAGRLTLNPLAHIDLFGTVLLPLFLILSNVGFVFGWAKPVPVNFNSLRGKWGPALVSLAGPAANFIFGAICLVSLHLLYNFASLPDNNLLVNFLFLLLVVNFVLMIFNLIPIPPLDGSKVLFSLLPARFNNLMAFLEMYGVIILIILLIFGSEFLNAIFVYFFRFVQFFI